MLIPALLLVAVTACDSYKILVIIPKMGYSHMNFLGSIADTLVDAGHEVVSMDQDSLKKLSSGYNENQSPIWTAGATNPLGILAFLPVLKNVVTISISTLLGNKELLEELKSENFDVGIGELFDFAGIAVFEAIGLKNVVGAHAQTLMEGTAYAVGVPIIPSFMPASCGVTDDSTALWNRATNLVFTFLSWYFQTTLANAADAAMVEKLGNDATPVWDVVKNMSWVLVNSEPFMEFAKPTLHKIVDLGGIGVHEPKPLDEKWSQILNLRKYTILICFGTVAPSIFMPLEMKKAIVEVIKSYPDVMFIWKYEEPENAKFADGVENLYLSKWTPQNDLLADERLTLFITHGGAGSTMESAMRGKPLIAVPLFGDQTRNAKLIVKFGFGLQVDKSRLQDSDVLREAIREVLKDPKYTRAAHRMRDLLAKRPFTPKEKLVKTMELAAEFGHLPELYVSGRDLSFIVYHNIDLFALLLGICLFSTYIMFLCTKKVLKLICAGKKLKVQ